MGSLHIPRWLSRAVLLIGLVPVLPLIAQAGGPFYVDPATGTAYSWQLPIGGPPDAFFNVETGPLNGLVNNAAAKASVLASFGTWEAVPTATITYTDAGTLMDCSDADGSFPPAPCSPGGTIDVDETNLLLVFPPVPDGQSPIVFDDDGALFAAFGLGPSVLGFARPEWRTSAPPFAIVEGFAMLNGAALGSDADLIEAVMTHEFGHFSNLAHSVVNGQSLFFGDETGPTPFDAFGPAPLSSVETMYPFSHPLTVPFTKTLHADDIAALSTIYPAPGFPASAGTITGIIFRPNRVTGITGVNVIARNVADPFTSAVSAISGDLTQGASALLTADGSYTLNGLPPGNYVVYIDKIPVDGGAFNTPTASAFTEEFYNGADEHSNRRDDPSLSTLVPVASVTSGIDIILQGGGAVPAVMYLIND
jgi:hypothetical protein